RLMPPVLCEILRSGFMIKSSLIRRIHLVQSLSVVFLYWFYVFSEANFEFRLDPVSQNPCLLQAEIHLDLVVPLAELHIRHQMTV
ncbi:hypothetical protein M8C21_031386, partial [Ambrosia artemisiifolia]